MKVSIYGRTVLLPDGIELPLADSRDDHVDLHVTIGPLPNSDKSFALDRAVTIHVAPGRASVEPLLDIGPRALEHYLVDHAVPNGLVHSGDVVMHCAGLVKDGQAIVLLGNSGQGKSTLSKYLTESGWALLGDDSVRIEVVDGTAYAWASYAGLRLHADMLGAEDAEQPLVAEYAKKRRVFLSETAPTSPLGLMVVLGDDAALATMPMGPAERCSALAMQAFFPVGGPGEALMRLDAVLPIAEVTDGRQISFRRTADGARDVVRMLDAWIESGS